MKLIKLKSLLLPVFVLPLLGFAIYTSSDVSTRIAADDEPAIVYKTKCAGCHSKNATRFFDASKTDEEHVQIILEGKKGEKPPYMPGYAAKGMTEEQALALVAHMRTLAPADDSNSNVNASLQ